MKVCFPLTLVCCVLLCLFLSLPHSIGLKHGLQIVGSRPWIDREREPTSDASLVSVATRMRFDLPRPAPLASPLLDCAWAAGNLGPPGSETPGPPKPIGPWQVAGQAVNSNQRLEHTLLHEKLLAQITYFEESGFRNSL